MFLDNLHPQIAVVYYVYHIHALRKKYLTHKGQICFSELDHHWFMWWIVACTLIGPQCIEVMCFRNDLDVMYRCTHLWVWYVLVSVSPVTVGTVCAACRCPWSSVLTRRRLGSEVTSLGEQRMLQGWPWKCHKQMLSASARFPLQEKRSSLDIHVCYRLFQGRSRKGKFWNRLCLLS